MTVYADILMLVNFTMDSFILWVISKCTRQKIKLAWELAGGLIMAVLFGVTLFLPAFQWMNAAIASVLILSIGVAVAFRPQNLRSFIKLLLIGYGVSFSVGGLGLALFYLTDLPYVVSYITDAAETPAGIPWKLAVVCVAVCYALIKLGVRLWSKIMLKRQELCPICVYLGDESAHFRALVDTGHSLREPISRSPVIVAEFEYIKKFLPDGLKVLFYEKQEGDFERFLGSGRPDGGDPFFKRMRMIPFTSLGRDNGLLIGFRPDRVAVGQAPREYEDVVIGIYNNRFTKDGKYQGLVSSELYQPAV